MDLNQNTIEPKTTYLQDLAYFCTIKKFELELFKKLVVKEIF